MVAQAQRCTVHRNGCGALLVIVFIGALAGCGPRRAERPLPSVDAGAGAAIPAAATVYAIDADRSIITLRVYRAGRLAKLGHNHVVTSTSETGRAWTNGAVEGSGFEVRVAVQELVVDDPAARAAAGPEFLGALSEGARAGTRTNMLRPEVLDGGRYPEIAVRADSLRGTWQQPTVAAQITLKGRTRTVEMPLAIERDAGGLTARGSFQVRQTDFDITPFDVGGGAIQVADTVDVSFEILARRE
jgi:polyisoprenoid-binding protein YceI